MNRWYYWSRRITPWLFYAGSALFFLAFVLEYLRSGSLNAENFVLGALMAVVPGLLQLIEERMK